MPRKHSDTPTSPSSSHPPYSGGNNLAARSHTFLTLVSVASAVITFIALVSPLTTNSDYPLYEVANGGVGALRSCHFGNGEDEPSRCVSGPPWTQPPDGMVISKALNSIPNLAFVSAIFCLVSFLSCLPTIYQKLRALRTSSLAEKGVSDLDPDVEKRRLGLSIVPAALACVFALWTPVIPAIVASTSGEDDKGKVIALTYISLLAIPSSIVWLSCRWIRCKRDAVWADARPGYGGFLYKSGD